VSSAETRGLRVSSAEISERWTRFRCAGASREPLAVRRSVDGGEVAGPRDRLPHLAPAQSPLACPLPPTGGDALKTICTMSWSLTRNITGSFELSIVFVCACVHTLCVIICFTCILIFTRSISPSSLGFCFVPILPPALGALYYIAVVSESDLESFFYETVYDVASTIDYSKEPIDAGVVDSPPPKQIFRQSPSPSPLKGVDRDSVRPSPTKPAGGITPQRRYGRTTYEERIPTYSLAGRFAFTREFGRKCSSCQGKAPIPLVYHTLQSFYP
jgi:hypothetical protein